MWDCKNCGTRNRDGNLICEVCNNAKTPPKPVIRPNLNVDKLQIDFGTLTRYGGVPVSIRIKNTGTGVLTVDITASVPFVHFLSPAHFDLGVGDSVEASLFITRESPQSGHGKIYSLSDMVRVNSNGGNEIIGGRYATPVTPKVSYFWLQWTAVTAISWLLMAYLGQTFGRISDLFSSVLMGTILDLILVSGQWFMLRSKIKNNSWWIRGSLIGLVCSYFLNFLILASPIPGLSAFGSEIIGVVIFSVSVGLPQALALRSVLNPQPLWKWIFFTILGFGVPVIIFSFNLFVPDVYLAIFIRGVSLGLFTGIPLHRTYLEE